MVLVLRGLSHYRPKPNKINLIWLISHPDKVDVEELKLYDHVFIASYNYTRKMMPPLGAKVTALLQCTDQDLFGQVKDVDLTRDLLFVGNSRGVDRWIPRICVDRNLPIEVYGADWDGRLPASVVKGQHIENEQLSLFYRSAKIVLNDHWPSMADNGFISNRIFDAGLIGTLVISDYFEGASIFGGGVVTCKNADEVEDAILYYLGNESERQKKVEQLQSSVRLMHTFDHRAKTIMRVISSLVARRPGLSLTTGVPSLVKDNMPTVRDCNHA